MEIEKTDILVIGSGVAGLFFSLKAARFSDVLIVTKRDAPSSNTLYAQGGIATVMDGSDSFDLHVADTMAAGHGLCDREAVEAVVREGPARIAELIELGVRFARDETGSALRLGREGGHSASRIVHYGDMTGREIENRLLDAVRDNRRIAIRENRLAIDLIKDPGGVVRGCFIFDGDSGEVRAVTARHVVLATGGAGKIYLYTSNPDVATGDGIAMAYRAGAEVANLEFVQFHPTCFYHPDVKSLLISEALRGEGAVLRNIRGEEFMQRWDPRKELAPRDVVARAIDMEMKRSGAKHVLLDITGRSREWLSERFPYVHENCLKYGIDISEEPIPVVPAAHYMCGGVKIDLQGRTNLDGLLAIGEVSCTDMHGANRLASNSLLEALVVSHRCAEHLREHAGEQPHLDSVNVAFPARGDPRTLETVILDHDWDLARRIMWDYVGIVRSGKRLGIARERIRQIQETIERLYREYGVSVDMVELRNIALVSSLVVESALSRKESRGLHYMIDYPDTDPAYSRDTIIRLQE